MNSGIPQCKNCWKWGHSTLSCHSHISRCAKCYGAYDTKYHREKAWCCMENKKVNHTATKVGVIRQECGQTLVGLGLGQR